MLTRPTPARRRRRDDWHRTDGGVWLPCAGDVPLRGAGVVRRGMGFGFEPAGCYCGGETIECTRCNLLDAEYDITISGYADSTSTHPLCGETIATGCNAINGTHRITFITEYINDNCGTTGCTDGCLGGCVWSSSLIGNSINLDYDDLIGCTDKANAPFAVNMSVVAGDDPETIDVTIIVKLAQLPWHDHYYSKTGISCARGILDGMEIPACGSYSNECFEGGVTGSATIDAVVT